MSDRYRLVFSGEIVEGQHEAVVKKRLAAVLKLTDERLGLLFSGKPVVVKKEADERTAARFQEVFKQAGARLRVLPVVDDSKPTGKAPDAGRESESRPDDAKMDVLPAGSNMLSDAERIDEPVQAPNVDHITLAELGTLLGVPADEVVVAEIEVSFTLAEVGAIIGQIDAAIPEPPFDLDSVDFELAEPGAILDTREKKPAPPPPDTSHITLDDS